MGCRFPIIMGNIFSSSSSSRQNESHRKPKNIGYIDFELTGPSTHPVSVIQSKDFIGSLYDTLYTYRVPTVLIDIIQSYCSQRTQFVNLVNFFPFYGFTPGVSLKPKIKTSLIGTQKSKVCRMGVKEISDPNTTYYHAGRYV